MEDIFGVTGGYSPYLGTGPGTINGMDNEYETSSSNSSRTNDKHDRRGSSSSRQSPTVNNDHDRGQNDRGHSGGNWGNGGPMKSYQQRSPQSRNSGGTFKQG